MISKFSKLGIATFALLATSFAANAADIPGKGGYYKGPPRSVVSYYNWTGFYAGINGGYRWGSTEFTRWRRRRLQHQPEGLAGRRHARLQLADRRDRCTASKATVDWVDAQGHGRLRSLRRHLRVQERPGSTHRRGTRRLCLRPLAALRHRRWRPSATSMRQRSAATRRRRRRMTGWTAGVGLEYAFLGNWTAKVEYLYVDLGTFDCEHGLRRAGRQRQLPRPTSSAPA